MEKLHMNGTMQTSVKLGLYILNTLLLLIGIIVLIAIHQNTIHSLTSDSIHTYKVDARITDKRENTYITEPNEVGYSLFISYTFGVENFVSVVDVSDVDFNLYEIDDKIPILINEKMPQDAILDKYDDSTTHLVIVLVIDTLLISGAVASYVRFKRNNTPILPTDDD